jgi:IPT/TIG domain
MKVDRRLAPWMVCTVLVAAIPAIGATTVAAAPAAAAHAATSPRAVPFLPRTNHRRATAGNGSYQRGGAAPVSLRGTSDASGAATFGHAAAAPSAATPHRRAAGPLVVSTPPDTLTGFGGISQASAIHSFGTDQEITPPDEDIAVGPTDVVETVNSAVYVLNRAGTVLGSADLTSFMDITPGYFSTDPRVIYDASAGRFWITVTEIPDTFASPSDCPAAQPVLIAVSPSSNPLPLSGWLVYALPMKTFGGVTGQPLTEFGDQPGLGVASNTITVTWSDFTCDFQFNGSEVDVLQKTDFEHDSGTTSLYFFWDFPFASQPVQAIGSMSAQYVVSNESDCGATVCASPAAEVDVFTGTPEGAGGVSFAGPVSVPMTPTAVDNTTFSTPPADQLGTPAQLQTDDDRFLNAVWQGGEIWTADGTSCIPTGDSVQRSCLNYVEIGADANGNVNPALTNQINNVGVNGAALFYPAVSVDSSGNLFTVFNESSTSMFPAIMDAAVPSGGSTLSSFQTLHTSTDYYDAGDCSLGCRWGDYAGAAQDPANPNDVWVVSGSEDGIVEGACVNTHLCWNTRIDQVTLAPPAITSLTPASGPVAGGQTVTVRGFDFAPDTTVSFAGAPIAISALTPASFTFVTPPSAAAGGVVQTQATDTLGASAEDAASSYTYVGLANYTPLTPYRILDTRAHGNAPLGPGAIRPLTVINIGSTPVPASATAVVLNVTEVSGTASSLLTVYPFGTTRPNASNLNFAAHTVIPNLVTVTLGPGGKVNIYNALGTVNVLADVEGYFAPPQVSTPFLGLFHPTSPVRVCDTRSPKGTAACMAHGALVAGVALKLDVTAASAGSIPTDGTAGAVVLNLTGVAGSATTFLTVFPTSSTGACVFNSSSPTSTLNIQAGAVQANRVIAALGPATTGGDDTSICVYAAVGKINVLLDASGWFGSATATATPAGFQYQAIAPTRICDTRVGSLACAKAPIGPASSHLIGIAGHSEVPAAGGSTTVVAIIANLTAIAPTQTTFLVLYPANLTNTRPNASDLNLNAGVVLPNLAVVQLDTMGDARDGEVELYNSAGSVNAIIDIEGWFQ